jgi:hypothetical protein
VLQAAATAFGFVYIHPFQDGNGRLHRCLIHYVLAERKFTPRGMVFPVSPVMLDRIDPYRDTLRAHSGPLMNFLEWRPTPERNVEVLNDTVEIPDRMAENLVRFIRLNEGKPGRKRREGEFEKLTDDEMASIEAIVREAFEGFAS